ncbi:FimV/HubP family polar landmark protein [Ramlibacter sp. AN1015]|uniref:FimV/HubP family polar landmark protein n=1 Tax=Ramlibacter sp. AN1015 TaxID=3133428 RepID=UPI0030C418A7
MMRTQLPALRAVHSPVPVGLPRLRTRAVALAAAMLLGTAAWDANALALGRVAVQSALGEPLRADIEVPQITPEEVESLRAAVASPEAFRSIGAQFHPVLAEARLALQRRPNGSYFLRLSSERPVADPFIDVVLEATWSSGRIVREFTLLLDPPHLRNAAPLAPQLPPAPAPAARSAAPASAAAASSAVPAGPGVSAQPLTAPPETAQRVTVRPGETAGLIASRQRPAAVSLEQMLTAMVRSNPRAFIDGNMNRLKAGSVLELPTASQAQQIGVAEARQVVLAHSRDFNEFRRRLAQGIATTAAVDDASRAAAGRVEAQVQEKSPANASPDRLTLSKGAVQGRAAPDAAAEERIARARSEQETAARVAELNRNIAELSRLSASTANAGPTVPAGGPPPTAGAVVPGSPAQSGVTMATPAALSAATAAMPTSAEAAAAPAAAAAASTPEAAPAGASAPAPVAPATAATAPAAAGTPAPAAAASPAAADAQSAFSGLLDHVLENPLVPAAAGGALALLLGLLAVRRRRRRTHQVDSSFLESRLQPDSFFGASGGQRIDTAESNQVTGTSMVYSPSQLDAAGDVDPVAEADVYLAYGRDLQAEEILKEALRINPQRIAIHLKLLEIHAKRRDRDAFELAAAEAHALTRGTGAEWSRICALGQDLDPDNPLYQSDRAPASSNRRAADLPPAVAAAATSGSALAAVDRAYEYGNARPSDALAEGEAHAVAQADPDPGSDVDLDLDLDFLQEAISASRSFPADDPTDAAPIAAAAMAAAATAASDESMAENQPSIVARQAGDEFAADIEFAQVSHGFDSTALDSRASGDIDARLASLADVETPSLRSAAAFDEAAAATQAESPAPTTTNFGTRSAEESAFTTTAPDATTDAFELPDLDLALPGFPEAAPDAGPSNTMEFLAAAGAGEAAASAHPAAEPAPLSFDLDGLSLDFDTLAPSAQAMAPSAAELPTQSLGAQLPEEAAELSFGDSVLTSFDETDPLETKLSLAEEFHAIGDIDGARSLAQEVCSEAMGALRDRAERFLAELG